MIMIMPSKQRIIFLSNIFDQHYHDVRAENIQPCMTIACRRDMFRCLETASGRELILLSSPPKPMERRAGKWLPEVETKFTTFRQFFCASWDIPKLRIPLSWFFYARHVLRHVRSGDVVVFDNYEFLYVVAARVLKLFRRVTFILAYLDGKHVIDRSWSRVLSALAETWGRPLLSGAVLSTPPLGERLPDSLPKVVMPGPGFIVQNADAGPRQPDSVVRFLYAGSLDSTRGVDLGTGNVATPAGAWVASGLRRLGGVERGGHPCHAGPTLARESRLSPAGGVYLRILQAIVGGLPCRTQLPAQIGPDFPGDIPHQSIHLLVRRIGGHQQSGE